MLKAPFPWFGGKSRASDLIWARFGDVDNFVEPFAGSLAVLLKRPHAPRLETVNDLDCYIANFWRAISENADAVAFWADWPVNEADLHARHQWLVDQSDFRERMNSDPDYYDPKIAGWWVWGLSSWIGSGWCESRGAVSEKRPHLGNIGMGVARPYLASIYESEDCRGAAVLRQLPHLGNAGRGLHRSSVSSLHDYFSALQKRLRRVRVCCGDWTRVLGPSVTEKNGITAILLDPPYAGDTGRKANLYNHDGLTLSADVREWAIANGDNPMLRIALCGYEGEHEMPDGWTAEKWKARGGYDGQNRDRDNQRRKLETIWFNKSCARSQRALWEVA